MEKVRLTEFQVISYGKMWGLFDGTRGGLVLGKRHSEGGIRGIRESEVEKEYDVVFEMEGGEYLMNAMATIKYKKRLEEINAYRQEEPEISDERIQSLHRCMDNRDSDGLIIISKYPHYIVNRNATAKYLEELDKMNQDALEEYLKEHPELT